MSDHRRKPVLLRVGPLTGRVNVLTSYRTKGVGGREVLEASATGKHDVTADYDAIVLETLLDPDSPDIISILDGVADGEILTDEERQQVRGFRERLRVLAERHNNTGHGAA